MAIRYIAFIISPKNTKIVQIQIIFCEYTLVANPASVQRNFAQKPEVSGRPIALNIKIKFSAASFGVRVASAPIKGSFVVLKICETKQKHKNNPNEIRLFEIHWKIAPDIPSVFSAQRAHIAIEFCEK